MKEIGTLWKEIRIYLIVFFIAYIFFYKIIVNLGPEIASAFSFLELCFSRELAANVILFILFLPVFLLSFFLNYMITKELTKSVLASILIEVLIIISFAFQGYSSALR